MGRKLVVHTGRGPEEPSIEERKALDAAEDIVYVQAGKRSTPEAVLDAVRDAHVGLCGSEPYTREVFAGAPNLLGVIRYGVGVDTIDLDAATEFGVMVGHFPDFCIHEVADHALSLLLAAGRKIARIDRLLREEGWNAARAVRSPMGCLHGETLGLLAFGNISQALARRALAMEMKVIAYDPFLEASVFERMGVESVGMDELAERSDYISCHIPLNDKTEGMINSAFFAKMKPTAYFVNTSRGPVVNEPDLIAALHEGQLAGAGLDVFEVEPLPEGHPFLTMDNVVLTPHMGSFADITYDIRDRRVGENAVTIARGGIPEFVANREVLLHRRR